MDLLRLALERGATAADAVRICSELLEEHGQGGACAEGDADWSYENSFLFADHHEAYVLETAGVRHWARERIPPGDCRNISNGLSIRAGEHISTSAGLEALCQQRGWWDGEGAFDWKRALSGGGSHASLGVCGREKAGGQQLASMLAAAEAGELGAGDARGWLTRMAAVLRDETSGICSRLGLRLGFG